MLAIRIFFVQRIGDHLKMFFITKEISVGSIHKQCFHIVLPDIMRIGFLNAEQIVVRDSLFIRTVPFFDILLQLIHRRVKVNEDLRLDQLLVHDLEQALI